MILLRPTIRLLSTHCASLILTLAPTVPLACSAPPPDAAPSSPQFAPEPLRPKLKQEPGSKDACDYAKFTDCDPDLLDPPPSGPPGQRDEPDTEYVGIHVVAGWYGANCAGAAYDRTPDLAAACNGKDRCAYVVDYRRLGDPAPGCAKSYIAKWRCRSGRAPTWTTSAAPEAGFGSVVTLTCR